MPPPPRNDGSRDSDTSPAFHLPQLVFSPVDLEEPPFARHRGRAAATTRGLPLAGAPSFSTTRHQQRRMTPPSTPSHDVQPLTPPETLARIGQRQLKEGAGHGEATRAASSVHTHHRSSEGASLLGLANYADEEEDEHRGPRGRANGRPREEEEEEDERRALERRPRQVELRRDCPYLDTVNRLEAAEASTDWQINDLALQATKSVQRRSWFHFLAYWIMSSKPNKTNRAHMDMRRRRRRQRHQHGAAATMMETSTSTRGCGGNNDDGIVAVLWRRQRRRHHHGAAAVGTTLASSLCCGGDDDDINTGLWRRRRRRPIRVVCIVYMY
ncbi:uncharacterized protein [Aegilops tauschii subsp. strangulata]|uniref:uncharacterized protein isoform X2 n=1 Tax=Aegilops tauschii subsp. strangulata TaxID=200361 RepID=UPI001ABD3E0E|nr:uncharacterized protein LOC109754533 isoform X2 [Aegilops tauschii subsp. strangulata]